MKRSPGTRMFCGNPCEGFIHSHGLEARQLLCGAACILLDRAEQSAGEQPWCGARVPMALFPERVRLP